MSQTLRKRCREPEVLPDSIDVREPKRFHGEETDRFLHQLQFGQSLAVEGDDCGLSEELINEAMRSLEEEITTTCSTSYSSNRGDNSAPGDISSGHEAQTLDSDVGVDLRYLLEASDDELGIRPNPIQDLKEEVCQSWMETSESLREIQDLKSLAENWHFGDDFEDYLQFAFYENFSDTIQFEDYMTRDFVSPAMYFFDGDFSTTWKLETARRI